MPMKAEVFALAGFLLTINSSLGNAADRLACGSADRPIAIGGITDFETLADPTATVLLRATCKVRLYLHANAVQRASDRKRLDGIFVVFRDTGPAGMEVGLQTKDPQIRSFLLNWIPAMIKRYGAGADEASVNGLPYNMSQQQLVDWKHFVDIAHYAGFHVVSPVFSPNGGQEPLDFFSPVYNNLRAAALYGGGITTDAPPGYFRGRGIAYQEFTKHEIVWANAHHLKSFSIFSPWGNAFRADTQAMLVALRKSNATPREYIFENYNPNMPSNSPTAIGRDTDTNSVSGVALWLARHLDGKTIE